MNEHTARKSFPPTFWFSLVDRAARSESPVLIQGERGTPVELVARLIHGYSERRGRPLVQVSATAISPRQMETVPFQEAHGTTLFVREISAVAAPVQAALAEMARTGLWRTPGKAHPEKCDARLLVSSMRAPERLLQAGELCLELLDVLAGFPIRIPPLRDRPDDLRDMIVGMLCEFDSEADPDVVLEALLGYDWPGNDDQFAAFFRGFLSRSGPKFSVIDLRAEACGLRRETPDVEVMSIVVGRPTDEQVLDALGSTNWQVTRAGRRLGISHQAISARIRRRGWIRPQTATRRNMKLPASAT